MGVTCGDTITIPGVSTTVNTTGSAKQRHLQGVTFGGQELMQTLKLRSRVVLFVMQSRISRGCSVASVAMASQDLAENSH